MRRLQRPRSHQALELGRPEKIIGSRPDHHYAIAQRPLSTRELRRYGLHNTPDDAILKREFTNGEK